MKKVLLCVLPFFVAVKSYAEDIKVNYNAKGFYNTNINPRPKARDQKIEHTKPNNIPFQHVFDHKQLPLQREKLTSVGIQIATGFHLGSTDSITYGSTKLESASITRTIIPIGLHLNTKVSQHIQLGLESNYYYNIKVQSSFFNDTTTKVFEPKLKYGIYGKFSIIEILTNYISLHAILGGVNLQNSIYNDVTGVKLFDIDNIWRVSYGAGLEFKTSQDTRIFINYIYTDVGNIDIATQGITDPKILATTQRQYASHQGVIGFAWSFLNF